MEKKLFQKIDYISFANVIATLAVVFLHVNGCFWDFSATEAYWKTANIIESIFYFAVPVFFMISGATLLDYHDRYGTKEFFLRRIHKSVIPYLGWSLISLIAQICLHLISIDEINARYVLSGLFAGRIVKIYWFFPVLFSVYLSVPVFALIPKEKKIRAFTYFAGVGFLVNILIPFLNTVSKLQIEFPISFLAGTGYLFYIAVGYLISHVDISGRGRVILYGLAGIGFIIHLSGTWYLSMATGGIDATFKGYCNLPSVLYSVGIFLCLKQIGTRLMNKQVIARFIRWVNNYTFGIYLIHVGVIWIICQVIPVIDVRSIIWRVSAPFVVFFISVAGIFILKKIPGVRKLVP